MNTILTDNPIRQQRIQLNLTQQQLALRSKVTTQVVTNAEAGLYQTAPASLVYFLDLDPVEYNEWVASKRLLNSHKFANRIVRPNEWLTFRKSIHPSFRGFCKLLVYQPSLLRDFELNRTRNNFSLASALKQVGLSNEELDTLRISHD